MKTLEQLARENFEVTETMDSANGRTRVFFKFYFPLPDGTEKVNETSTTFWKNVTQQEVVFNLRNRWKREYEEFLKTLESNDDVESMSVKKNEKDISALIGKRGQN